MKRFLTAILLIIVTVFPFTASCTSNASGGVYIPPTYPLSAKIYNVSESDVDAKIYERYREGDKMYEYALTLGQRYTMKFTDKNCPYGYNLLAEDIEFTNYDTDAFDLYFEVLPEIQPDVEYAILVCKKKVEDSEIWIKSEYSVGKIIITVR